MQVTFIPQKKSVIDNRLVQNFTFQMKQHLLQVSQIFQLWTRTLTLNHILVAEFKAKPTLWCKTILQQQQQNISHICHLISVLSIILLLKHHSHLAVTSQRFMSKGKLLTLASFHYTFTIFFSETIILRILWVRTGKSELLMWKNNTLRTSTFNIIIYCLFGQFFWARRSEQYLQQNRYRNEEYKFHCIYVV